MPQRPGTAKKCCRGGLKQHLTVAEPMTRICMLAHAFEAHLLFMSEQLQCEAVDAKSDTCFAYLGAHGYPGGLSYEQWVISIIERISTCGRCRCCVVEVRVPQGSVQAINRQQTFANQPPVSKETPSGRHPTNDTRPCVGRMPRMPQ